MKLLLKEISYVSFMDLGFGDALTLCRRENEVGECMDRVILLNMSRFKICKAYVQM